MFENKIIKELDFKTKESDFDSSTIYDNITFNSGSKTILKMEEKGDLLIYMDEKDNPIIIENKVTNSNLYKVTNESNEYNLDTTYFKSNLKYAFILNEVKSNSYYDFTLFNIDIQKLLYYDASNDIPQFFHFSKPKCFISFCYYKKLQVIVFNVFLFKERQSVIDGFKEIFDLFRGVEHFYIPIVFDKELIDIFIREMKFEVKKTFAVNDVNIGLFLHFKKDIKYVLKDEKSFINDNVVVIPNLIYLTNKYYNSQISKRNEIDKDSYNIRRNLERMRKDNLVLRGWYHEGVYDTKIVSFGSALVETEQKEIPISYKFFDKTFSYLITDSTLSVELEKSESKLVLLPLLIGTYHFILSKNRYKCQGFSKNFLLMICFFLAINDLFNENYLDFIVKQSEDLIFNIMKSKNSNLINYFSFFNKFYNNPDLTKLFLD